MICLYAALKRIIAARDRCGDSQSPHFTTVAVINWIDVLSRTAYKHIMFDSLKYAQPERRSTVKRMDHFD
jgi:hypothetical protein